MPARKNQADAPEAVPAATEAAAADHEAAKAEAAGTELRVEYDGQAYTLHPTAGGDVELMEDTARLGDGDMSVMPRIVERLLGSEQYVAFKNRYRSPETGVVPMNQLRELFKSFDTALGE